MRPVTSTLSSGQGGDQSRRPQQGRAVGASGRDASRGGLPAARPTRRNSHSSTSRTVSSSSIFDPAISRSTSGKARSTSASPAATCCSTPTPTPSRSWPLGFGRSRFRFAAPVGSDMAVEKLHDLRLATSYPGLVDAYLEATRRQHATDRTGWGSRNGNPPGCGRCDRRRGRDREHVAAGWSRTFR